MGNFEPVRTLADLESLDPDEILAGYQSAERGDPEPGPNRGRSFWHGWRNRQLDMGELPQDDASRALASAVMEKRREPPPIYTLAEVRAKAKADPSFWCGFCPSPTSLRCMCRTEGGEP